MSLEIRKFVKNELVVAIGATTSGRAHARTGDRYQDMEEMKNEK